MHDRHRPDAPDPNTLPVPRHFSLTALIAAVLATALLAAGCGNSVPSDSVAKVGDAKIAKATFNHWLVAAARQQSQTQPGQNPAEVAVPDPPTFAKCIATKQREPLPKGAQKPPVAQLKAQCKQQYDSLKQQTMQFLLQSEWIQQEAKKRGVKVTDAQVQKNFQDQKKQAFPKEKE